MTRLARYIRESIKSLFGYGRLFFFTKLYGLESQVFETHNHVSVGA